jgi:hypothetical protein
MANHGEPKKRRGRPRTRPYKARQPVPLGVRIPPQMKDLLDTMAGISGRSQGREIEALLKRSTIKAEARLTEAAAAVTGTDGAGMIIALAIAHNIARRLAYRFMLSEVSEDKWNAQRWLSSDPRCWVAFTDAVAHLYTDEGDTDPGPEPKPGEWDRIGPWSAATARAKLQHGLANEFWPPDRPRRRAAKVDTN